MKKRLFITLLGVQVFMGTLLAQQDTISVSTPGEATGWVFAHLNPQNNDGRLIERALEAHDFTLEQMSGNYDQVHDFTSWLWMYTDILKSLDTNDVDSLLEQKINQLGEFVQEHNFDTERQIMPFGLVLYRVNQLSNADSLTFQDNQIIPPSNEESIYKQRIIRAAASLELYGDNEFKEGLLKFDSSFISVGQEVEQLSIEIDAGNGFQSFNAQQSDIIYDRRQDSLIGRARLVYRIDTLWHTDTLSFYLTKEGVSGGIKSAKNNKEAWPFDSIDTFNAEEVNVNYKLGVIFGCGNNKGLRRPILFVPPYRPNLQPVTLKGYYKQYNVKALFHELYLKGYDIVILKDKKGNGSLQTVGQGLLELITEINNQKKANYPDEYWENTVIGFSMGGQVSRFALMLGEKQHMEEGKEHPHTKLYIPFDSPHHGVNIPIGCQTVIYELARTLNPLAMLHRIFLKDEASKDMGMHSIFSSSINNTGIGVYKVDPLPAPEHIELLNDFNSNLAHDYTISTDQRKAFPSFPRNVGVSMGSYVNDYTSDPSEGLIAGQLMFKQNVVTPIVKPWPPFIIGTKWTRRELYAAKYGSNKISFKRNDVRLVGFAVPVVFYRDYYTNNAREWDNAQGGHKNVFYKGAVIGATSIMRSTTLGIGTRLYDNDVMFLPLVSSLAINTTLWPGNDLYYNPRNEALFAQSPMYASFYFGYPNVGLPSSHFQITPFEAVFADQYTFEHIKYSELDDIPNWSNRLDTLRNFLMNEIEADVVQLQNKVIGANNIITDPNHIYKAWYKGKRRVEFGNNITYKTDEGDYIIKEDGDITAYAQESVELYPGFDAQFGSDFHAYIDEAGFCESTERRKGEEEQGENGLGDLSEEIKETTGENTMWQVYPNPVSEQLNIVGKNGIELQNIRLLDMNGKELFNRSLSGTSYQFSVAEYVKGIYLLEIRAKEGNAERKKVLIQH